MQSIFRVPVDGGEAFNVVGERITFKATTADTGDSFFLFEMIARAGGPPPHTHPSSETFSILEGEIDFSVIEDGVVKTIHAVPGETVCIPAGAVHTYYVAGATPCRCLAVLVPGNDLEGFFREIGTPIAPGQPEPTGTFDIPAMLAAADRHGLVFMLPEAGE